MVGPLYVGIDWLWLASRDETATLLTWIVNPLEHLVLIPALVTLGFVALLLPGFVVMVRLYFGAQAVIVDRRGVFGALRESGSLTGDGRWLKAFGVLLLLWIPTLALEAAMGPAYDALEGDGARVALGIVHGSLAVSFTALVGTLLFFDLRARRDRSAAVPRAAL